MPFSYTHLDVYKRQGINWTDLLTRTGITQDYRLAIALSLIHILQNTHFIGFEKILINTGITESV